MASASYLVLEELLRRGHDIVFVSKRSFVYPARLVADYPNLRFVDATNAFFHKLDTKVRSISARLATITGIFNHATFIRLVLERMRSERLQATFDAALFLGLAAPQCIEGLPTVSWLQGPPGTDVRSLSQHAALLRRTEGWFRTTLLQIYGFFKSHLQRPALEQSDHLIVGSAWSAGMLNRKYSIPAELISAIPYPIDFSQFPISTTTRERQAPLNVLWLGRVVPRKRLDLFLDGLTLALKRGIAVRAHVVGNFTFCPGLKSLLSAAELGEFLTYTPHVTRSEAAELLRRADVLCQPSDEENFGSSVAEAQVCGIPVIVGRTNGTADYICPRSIRLKDDSPETLADTLTTMSARKAAGTLLNVEETRRHAEEQFCVVKIVDRLEEVCRDAGRGRS